VQTVIRDLLTKARNLLTLTPRQAIREVRFDGRRPRRPTPTDAQLEHLLRELAARQDPRLAGLKEDLARANYPGWVRGDPRSSGNCGNCMVAYELRRRGIDAQALPAERGRSLFDVMQLWDTPDFYPRNKNQIIEELEAAGPGARGFVSNVWRVGGGHMFNAENVDGIVQFVDAQSNRLDVSYYFDRSVRGHIFYAPSDILDTPNVIDLMDWVAIKGSPR
jgi:hypothetical protein